MSKKKIPIKIEVLLSIIALITGIVSLLFSCQANQIARQQITSEMAILDVTDPYAPKGEGQVDVYYSVANIDLEQGIIYGSVSCEWRIRLTNLGGAPTSLIGYKAEVSFGNEKTILESRKSTEIQGSNLFNRGINSFELSITNAENQETPITDVWINMPIKIDAFETLDITAMLAFNYSFSLNSKDEPILRIVYIFEFSPKQYLVSPSVNCTSDTL